MPAAAPIIAAVIGVGGSMMAANKASGAAEESSNAQRSQLEQDRAFRMKMYDEEKVRRDRSEAPLWAELAQSPQVAFGKYSGMVNQGFDNAGRAIEEKVAGAKMQGSGLDLALKQGNELERGKALSAAWQQGLTDKKQLAAMLAGRTVAPQMGLNVSAGNQGLAAFYGGQADRDNHAAGQAWGSAGRNLANFFSQGKENNWWQSPNPGAAEPPPNVSATGWDTGAPTWNWGTP